MLRYLLRFRVAPEPPTRADRVLACAGFFSLLLVAIAVFLLSPDPWIGMLAAYVLMVAGIVALQWLLRIRLRRAGRLDRSVTAYHSVSTGLLLYVAASLSVVGFVMTVADGGWWESVGTASVPFLWLGVWRSNREVRAARAAADVSPAAT